MADAPDNSTYLLVNADSGSLPNSRTLIADPVASNLQYTDGGPGGTFEISPTLNLAALAVMSAGGLVAYTGGTFANRTLLSDGSIAFSNPSGAAGNPSLSVVDNTSIQFIQAQTGGVATANPRSIMNFISGANVTVNAVDNSADSRTDVTISANSGIPINGSVVYTAGATGHSFNLGTLTSGLLKIGVSGAIATPATAIANTDYLSPTTTLVEIGAIAEVDAGIIVGADGAWVLLPPADPGDVLTISPDGVSLRWTDGGSALNWSTILPVQYVNMQNGSDFWGFLNTGRIGFHSFTGSLGSITNALAVVENIFYTWDDSSVQTRIVGGLFDDASYGLANTLLVGNGNSYTALPPGAENDVLSINGSGDIEWLSGAEAPSGSQGVLGVDGTLFVSDPSITTESVIFASSLGFGGTAPAAGPITVELNPASGFTISGDGTNDASKGVVYATGLSGSGGVTSTLGVPVDFVIYQTAPSVMPWVTYAYDNGESGLGAIIEIPWAAGLWSGLLTDGFNITLDNGLGLRVLWIDDSQPQYNGVYIITRFTDDAGVVRLTRSTDFNTAHEMKYGQQIIVSDYELVAFPVTGFLGNYISRFVGSTFTFTTAAPITIGTTPLKFTNPILPQLVAGARTYANMATIETFITTPDNENSNQPITKVPYGGLFFNVTSIIFVGTLTEPGTVSARFGTIRQDMITTSVWSGLYEIDAQYEAIYHQVTFSTAASPYPALYTSAVNNALSTQNFALINPTFPWPVIDFKVALSGYWTCSLL